jgi:hypothetical protein
MDEPMRTARRSPARTVVAALARGLPVALHVVAAPALMAAVLVMAGAAVVPPVAVESIAVESITGEAGAVAKRAEPAGEPARWR